MKNGLLTILILFNLLVVASCSEDTIRATGEITERDVYIADFTSVEILNGFTAYVTFSETKESVKIEANENLHDHIVISKKDNKLIVRFKNNLKIKGRETLNVYITAKSINNFVAAADAQIYLENMWDEDLAKIKVTADSFFSGEVNINNLEVEAIADASVDLFGAVNTMRATLSADSKLSDYSLQIEDLKMKMTADCYAHVTVNKTIDIEAVGDCTLRYKGNAIVTHESIKADSRLIKVN